MTWADQRRWDLADGTAGFTIGCNHNKSADEATIRKACEDVLASAKKG